MGRLNVALSRSCLIKVTLGGTSEFCRFGFIEIYIVGNADSYLQEWHSSTRQLFGEAVEEPLRGRLKCNIDAAVFDSDNATAWAAVVRDWNGRFVHC
ncbi:hypothetical protein GOBAR_DD15669 [Gossypium barbadense]|nr:hypothetical protein GOBAR_DD15669 [Gossypium barbadense]